MREFLNTPRILSTIMGNVRRQERFLKSQLGPELDEARKNKDESLTEDDFRKVTRYYGLAVPAILGEALCVLRGRPMTQQERMACTYQGAMTGLFDDFFDRHDMSDELLRTFIERPDELNGENSNERLFLQFYRTARVHFCNPDLTQQYLRKVYDAQIESRLQAAPGLSKDKIKRITINKGGVSVLFYRSVFNNPLSPEEESALYQVGGLMQFGNDIFDVWKDSLGNIETLVTTTQHINEVRECFDEMTRTSFASVYNTHYPGRNIRNFLRMVSMSLCGRCHVCLDQLESNQVKSNGIFTPKDYDRAELVCDMDTARNKWRSIRYYMKVAGRI